MIINSLTFNIRFMPLCRVDFLAVKCCDVVLVLEQGSLTFVSSCLPCEQNREEKNTRAKETRFRRSRFVFFRPSSCSSNFSPVGVIREESEIVRDPRGKKVQPSVAFLFSVVFRDISLLHAHYSYGSDLHSCKWEKRQMPRLAAVM